MVARNLVGAALAAVERLPSQDRWSLMRAIAKQALWHMPNAVKEARKLVDVMQIENLKQQHPDDPPGRD